MTQWYIAETLKMVIVIAVSSSLLWWCWTTIQAEKNRLCLEVDGKVLNECLARCQVPSQPLSPADCGKACSDTSCIHWRK